MIRSPHRRSRSVLLLTALGALASPAVAQASAIVDLGPQAWSGAQSNGFSTSAANVVSSVSGTFGIGSTGAFSWCDPYANSAIQSAVVNVVRGQSASPVSVTVGPATDGSGGIATPDSQIATAGPGTNLVLGNASSPCVGAAVTQTQIASSPARRWTLGLADVSLVDEQGPSVIGEMIRGPEVNGWYTGPVTVFWEASDNQLLRGTTGVQISDGPSQNLGDAADNTELSALLDPGVDGQHTVTVYRTGGGGWPTAEASVVINVDRTPPSVPQMISPPTGVYPAPLTTTPSTDGASGSGVARIEFSDDDGQTILGSDSLTVPGTYRVAARAVDVAGNASAWSPPISIDVPMAGSSPGGAGTTQGPHLARIRVNGRAPDASGTAALTGTWGSSIVVDATLADGLGVPAGNARVVLVDARGVLARGTTDHAGKIVLRLPVRRSGTVDLTANGGAPLAHIALRMRPLVVLDPSERHAVSGQPLNLGAGRVLTVTGTAAPGGIVTGQPVELEYRVGRTWLPLGLPTAVSRGRHWRLVYAVSRPGTATVRMRVLLPSQPGLPFAAGTTPAFRVAIR